MGLNDPVVTGLGPAPTSPNMAPPPTIDVASYIKDTFGDEVVGPGETPGTVKVKHTRQDTNMTGMPMFNSDSTEYIQVDAAKMIRDAGGDPDKINMQLGTPEKPMNENPLGFVDRVKMTLATEPSNKMKLLKDKFGEENVTFNPDQGQFIVKKDNGYYNATNSGVAATLAAKGPEIAGNLAGAAFGSLAGPVGTVAGGTLGSALGQIGTVAIAHSMGIRDEIDADEVTKEVGKEMLWNVAFGSAPYAIAKAGVLGVGAVSKALSKADEMIANPSVRSTFSKMLGYVTGEDPVHYAVALNNPEEWSAAQKVSSEWEAQKLANAGAKEGQVANQNPSPENEVNPIKLRMANMVSGAIERGRKSMQSEFGAVMDSPEVISATKEAKVDIGNLTAKTTTGQTVNVENQLVDLKKSIGASSPSDSTAIDKVLSDLREMRGQSSPNEFKGGPEGLVSEAPVAPEKIAYKDAQEMKRRVDRILEAQGAYDKPTMQVSTETQRALQMYRSAISDRAMAGVTEVDPETALTIAKANQTYSSKREMFDNLGGRKAFEPENIDTTLSKLGGPKGERLRQNLSNFLSNTDGSNTQELLRRIDIDNAVLHTSKLFGNAGPNTAGVIKTAGKVGAQLTAASVGKLQRIGQTAAFFANRSESVRKEMFNNPEAINALVNMFGQSMQIENQTKDQLTQQAMQSTAPTGQ